MKLMLLAVSSLALLLAFEQQSAQAQPTQPTQSRAAAPQASGTGVRPPDPNAAAKPAVEPEAIAGLERMGAYLRTLTSFEITATTTSDEVTAENGQRLTFSGVNTYRIRRPNAFYVETRTDRRQRQFYYDGRTFTVYSPRMKFYAQAPAPGTIAETVAEVEERFNINFPLTDLFYWGTDRNDPSEFSLATVVGYARIGEAHTDQYAFRQGDLDWQVWIQRGAQPVPLRVIITTRSDEARPQYSADLTWNFSPRFDNAMFAFRPPADARRIQFAEPSNQVASNQE